MESNHDLHEVVHLPKREDPTPVMDFIGHQLDQLNTSVKKLASDMRAVIKSAVSPSVEWSKGEPHKSQACKLFFLLLSDGRRGIGAYYPGSDEKWVPLSDEHGMDIPHLEQPIGWAPITYPPVGDLVVKP